jgi:hypothetical protein
MQVRLLGRKKTTMNKVYSYTATINADLFYNVYLKEVKADEIIRIESSSRNGQLAAGLNKSLDAGFCLVDGDTIETQTEKGFIVAPGHKSAQAAIDSYYNIAQEIALDIMVEIVLVAEGSNFAEPKDSEYLITKEGYNCHVCIKRRGTSLSEFSNAEFTEILQNPKTVTSLEAGIDKALARANGLTALALKVRVQLIANPFCFSY